MKPRVDFIYIDSGGGHRAAVSALTESIAQKGYDWDIRPLNIQDLLAQIDFIRKSTGVKFEEVYNIILRRGWTGLTGPLLPVAHTLIKASHHAQVAELEKFWRKDPPAMVVSLIPHYNRAMFQALGRVSPGTPYVTILTDVADFPPDFWLFKQDQWVICGCDKAVDQAHKIGLPPDKILRASGLIVNPKFYDAVAQPRDKAAERRKLGLDPSTPTGLVLFGGEGSMQIPRIVKAIDAGGLKTQLIVVCGRNARAANAVRALKLAMPIHVEEFTRDLPHFMGISDYVIGKPGPGCLTEAFLMGLPVIVERNAGTMPQERYNTQWVKELGAGIVIRSISRITQAVGELLEPERLEQCRKAVARIENRAVFEIPEMLAKILASQNAPRKQTARAH